MIFAADLDRTLIFSQRRLNPDGPATVPVEYRQGEPFGFMTPGGLTTLRTIQTETIFFLNTLRGLEQAQRVTFIADGSCPYLALQNGLYLYRHGQEDQEWAAYVRRTVSELPLSLSDGAAQVVRELPGIRCLSKQYEYLAVFFVEDSFDDHACAQLSEELARLGWALCRQGGKLYLSPLQIHKGAVLKRVCLWESEDVEQVIGFGDSGFDLPMLRACGKAYSLRDCELWGHNWGFPIFFSAQPAQAGTEEILTHIRAAHQGHRNGTFERGER